MHRKTVSGMLLVLLTISILGSAFKISAGALTVSITPSSVTMEMGQSQLFTSTISGGTPPYSYQWYQSLDPILSNTIINSGFETGSFTGWNQEGPNDAQIRDDEKHSGSYSCASFYVWPYGYEYLPFKISQKLPSVASNAVASVSCWRKWGTSSDWFRVNYTDGSDSSIGLGGIDDWSRVTLNLAAGKTVDSLILERTTSQGTVICVDDVEFSVNGAAVEGATGSTWTFTPSSTGTYYVYVHVTDNAGFSEDSNIATVIVNPVTLSLSLNSRQDNYSTANLGTIIVGGVVYSLPRDISKEAGNYPIQYNPASGYEFDHWEATGGITVTNPSTQSTSVIVNGNGNLTVFYKKSVINYPIYLSSREDNGTATNQGTIHFDNQSLSLPNNVTKPSGVYLIDYIPPSGNIFLQWETSNNITTSNATSQQTFIIINGTGTITAVFIRSTPVPPAISEVKAFYTLDSFFLGDMPELVPPNQYFVRGNNISAAEFTIYINSTKQSYLDLTPDQDGWFNSDPIDMAEVTSNLTITAYSMTGDHVSHIVFTNVYQTPTWLQSSINFALKRGYLTVKIDPAQPLTRFDNVWSIGLDYHWPETPMDAVYDIQVPIIGGKYGITCGFGFTLGIQSNAKAVVGGGGGLQFYIADAEAKIGIYVTGAIGIQNGTIRLQNLAITINGAIQVPFRHKYSWNGIGLDVGVDVGGSVSCTLYLQEAPSGDGTFGYGLDWVATKADIALWLKAYAQVGLWVGEVRIEGQGKVTFTFHMPPPYFTYPDDLKLEASITLSVRTWFFSWKRDIFTYSSHSPVQWTLNSSETGWIPREWANSNYSLYEWPGNATEGTFLRNVYPYANPSVDTSSNSTIMVWTQDDLSKPYIQGYEIYYATLDPKTGNWSLPAPATSDTIPEGDAVVKFDSKGNAVAVWTQLDESSLNETMDPFSLLKKVQLAYAVWNPVTKTWTQPRQITTDEIFHYSPTLISDNDTGNLMLIWMADNDGNLTTYNDESIYSSIWNGTAWSIPTLVATPGLLASSVSGAYHQGKAALVWSQNTGDNATNLSDLEIFSTEFNGTSWTPPTRLTNNNRTDTSPSVTYWNNYPVYGWVQRVQNQSDIMMVLEPRGANVSKQVLERPTIFSLTLKVDSYNRLLVFWTSSDLPYSCTLNSEGTITIAEMANGDNSSKNIYCGVYKYTAGMADFNYDGIVDIYDAIGLAGAFNSVPGSHNWNTDADINGDGIVDVLDAITLANNYEDTFSNRIGCRQITIPS